MTARQIFGVLAVTPFVAIPAMHAADRRAGDNAALQYLQAFCLMPPQTADPEKPSPLSDWETMKLDAQADTLLAKYDEPLRFLRRGASRAYCEWGLERSLAEEGWGAPLPHLSKARELARAALLRARYEFSRREAKAAVDDLLATLVLARRVPAGSGIIGLLSGCAIELEATRLGASYLLDVPTDQLLRTLGKGLDALPPPTSLSSVVRTEKEVYIAHIRTRGLKALAPYGMDDAEIAKIQGPEANGDSREAVEKKSVSRLCDALNLCFDKAADIARLPREQCRAAEKDLRDKLDQQSDTREGAWIGAVRSLIPPVWKLRVTETRMQATRALLGAALQIAVDGPKTASGSRDPFGAGPFRYDRLEDGFRLESALTDHEGKPIGLTVERHRR